MLNRTRFDAQVKRAMMQYAALVLTYQAVQFLHLLLSIADKLK